MELDAGLVVGLAFGFYHAASPDFRIVNWWLAARGKVPWRLKHFLEDAYQKTVLRQAGASYEFRHVVLRDRLAARLRDEQQRAAAIGPDGRSSARPGQSQSQPGQISTRQGQ